MDILFVIKANISCAHYMVIYVPFFSSSPRLCSLLSREWLSYISARGVIFFKHMCFWCLFFEPHEITATQICVSDYDK